MAYERIKTVYGRQYRYIVEGKRVNGKVKQRVVKYLGPVDPIYKRKRKHRENSRIFVRDLTDDEKHVLEKCKSSPSGFIRDRARIILFSSEGLPCLIIASKLNCDVRKVRKAVKEFNRKGIGCLERKKAKGADLKFTKEERAKMLGIASTDPVRLGVHFTTWSLRKLKRYFESEGVVKSISIASIRTIFKSEGINWRKSKRWQYSNDPEFVKKNF
jgi:transposase